MAYRLGDPMESGGITRRVAEDQLMGEIAYYKARLADMDRAPDHSRHRDGRERVAARLRESEQRLSQLRQRRYGTRPSEGRRTAP